MDENEQENLDSENTETEPTENKEEQVDVEALRKEIETLKAQKDHWREKVNKPKEEVKTEPKVEAPKDDLTSKDLYALMESKVSQDDIEDVIKASKLLNKSIPEALKDDVVKAILDKKMEVRKTADVANTQATRRVTTKDTPEALLSEALKGNLPESDEDIAKLAEAHLLKDRKK